MAEQVERSDRQGLLFASGLITGEAIIGILLAIPIVVAQKPDLLAVFKEPSRTIQTAGTIVGLILLAGVTFWLYVVARGRKSG